MFCMFLVFVWKNELLDVGGIKGVLGCISRHSLLKVTMEPSPQDLIALFYVFFSL